MVMQVDMRAAASLCGVSGDGILNGGTQGGGRRTPSAALLSVNEDDSIVADELPNRHTAPPCTRAAASVRTAKQQTGTKVRRGRFEATERPTHSPSSLHRGIHFLSAS